MKLAAQFMNIGIFCFSYAILRDFVIKLENMVADIRILEPCLNSCAHAEGCI